MKSIVTGGAGFIGSHLVDRLLAAGDRVTVLDNLATGRESNLSHCQGNSNLRFVQFDITDLDGLAEYFQGVDHVYHLAGLADIVPSIDNPVKYFQTNVNGSMAIAEAARRAGVRRIVYAASSSCYGIPDEYPTPETAPLRPQYPYALSKYLGEETLLHWGQVYGIPVVSLRLFNVYGPRARTSGTYGAVMGVFLAQKFAGKALTIVGDGEQTRDFTYVTDVAEAFYAAAHSDLSDIILNVGSGGTYSIIRLVELIGGEKTYLPKRPGEPDCTFADIQRIGSLLNWKPQVTFEEGVGRLVAGIEAWKDAPVWTPETIHEATRTWFKHLGSTHL